jgi:hypothetical protein
MRIIFGFGVSDSMFLQHNGQIIVRRELTPEGAQLIVAKATEEGILVPAVNPSHKTSLEVMEKRFGISVPVPEVAPKVSLQHGDTLVLMGISGLPRLQDRHEYTSEEVNAATFTFSAWTVIETPFNPEDLLQAMEHIRN